MILRIAILLLLCSAGLPVLASEGSAANGEKKGCTCSHPAEERGGTTTAAGPGADAASGDSPSQPRRGGNAENTVRGPRMHNLLPGMFR